MKKIEIKKYLQKQIKHYDEKFIAVDKNIAKKIVMLLNEEIRDEK